MGSGKTCFASHQVQKWILDRWQGSCLWEHSVFCAGLVRFHCYYSSVDSLVNASGPCPILIPKGNITASGWRLWGYETSSTQRKIWASSAKKLIIAVLCSSWLEMFQLNWIFTGERTPMWSCLERVSIWRTSQIHGVYSQASECQCVSGKWTNLIGWWRQFCISV